MADVSWFEEHATPAGSGRRSTGRTSSKFKRAARRLARQGHAAQAGKFAELAETARMLEPSIMRPEFRQLEEAAQGIKAMEDEAIARGIDFEKDIAPLRGNFFQAVNDAGSLSPDEKQMLRDKYGKGFTEDALAVDERAAKKAQRDVAQKQADAAAWKQGQVEKDAKLERKALKKLDEITKSMTDWRTKNPHAKPADAYAERRKKVREAKVPARIQNTEAWTKDHSRRVTEHANEVAMEQRAGQAKLQTASVVADALRGITDPMLDSETGEMISAEERRAKIIHQFFTPGSLYADHAKRLSDLNVATHLSSQKAAAAEEKKAIRDHYAGIAKELDSLATRNFQDIRIKSREGSLSTTFVDADGHRTHNPLIIISDLRALGHRAYGREDPNLKKLLDAAAGMVTPADADNPAFIKETGREKLMEAYDILRANAVSYTHLTLPTILRV